jgi:hypothetical protein
MLLAAGSWAWAHPAEDSARRLTSGSKDVRLDDGTVVTVEAGELQVPESRRRPTGAG